MKETRRANRQRKIDPRNDPADARQMILTLSVLFPGIGERAIVGILSGGGILAIVAAIGVRLFQPGNVPIEANQDSVAPTEQPERERATWRMPPLSKLPPARLTTLNRVWLIVLRRYLIVAGGSFWGASYSSRSWARDRETKGVWKRPHFRRTICVRRRRIEERSSYLDRRSMFSVAPLICIAEISSGAVIYMLR